MAAPISDASTLIERGVEEHLFVFDRRHKNAGFERKFMFSDLKTLKSFQEKIKEEFNIADEEKYVITTTNREEICDEESWNHMEPGDTLYILSSKDQELSAQTQERVSYLPHYDTIVKGGMYEYYASEGQNPLPYAFAELVDNSLAATADNCGPRNIEIRLHLDEANPVKNAVYVIDNGKGMSSRQLNNWAVYRLSKFVRNNRKGKMPSADEGQEEVRANTDVPRSLNSDISYFGVGGKQAIFFIGSTCRMITKPKGSRDVHELTISKEEFEEKEKNKEAIYSGYIRNRKPGDASHIAGDEETLRGIVAEEANFEQFTVAVINNISAAHVPYLRANVQQWTRQLAHIYHYYIHGPYGNCGGQRRDGADALADSFSKINIEVKLYPGQGKPVRQVNLRDVQDDLQSQFIRSCASSFEFKAIVEGSGVVEGILRYHPFLYDRETYPTDSHSVRPEAEVEDDHDFTLSETRPARGKRPVFECYWNGRLIPYTTIEELDWCATPKKMKNLPLECYNRISGVLWTNDKFQVSTNKLTFIDLEMKLKEKQTAYLRILGKNEKRTDMFKEFSGWLKECHDYCDKQVKFTKYLGALVRPELPRNKQSPWTTFAQIEWDSKAYKQGQMVKIIRTLPFFYGSIKRFILYGDHSGDVFATGGELEIQQEPRTLYDVVRTVPLSKLDRNIEYDAIKKAVQEEEAKLPEKLVVTWPEGDEVKDGEEIPAGQVIGDMRVEIQNRKGESIQKLPGNSSAKLLVELKVIWKGASRAETVINHVCQHGKTWPYWFKKMSGILKNLGQYSLQLQAVLNESGNSAYGGRALPSHSLTFYIKEGDAEKFSLGVLDGPCRVGVPFNLPIDFQDEFGHPTTPLVNCSPVLTASGLSVAYERAEAKGSQLVLRGVRAEGSVKSSQGENFQFSVKIAGMKKETQTMKIRMLPGAPHTLVVNPENDVRIENGKDVKFDVEVRDLAGNLCSQPKLIVNCKFVEVSGLPMYHADCSSNGKGCLKGGPIFLDRLKENQKITARLDLQGNKNVPAVERMISLLPSNRTAELKVFYNKDGVVTELEDGVGLVQTAGSTLNDLTFRVFDEAGREKTVDDSLASKIKVNWVKATKDQIKQNKLPALKAPISVQDNKYCHVTVNDGPGFDVAFTIKSVPGPPAALKCTCMGSCKARNGEKLQSDLLIVVKDSHGNEIRQLEDEVVGDITLSCEGLMVDKLVKSVGKNNDLTVSNIEFEKSSWLGSREIHVKWRHLEDYVRVEIVAGPAEKITLLDWDTSQPVTVYNEGVLPQRLVCQVCDSEGNAAAQDNVRIQIAKDKGLQLSPAPEPIKTDKKGRADFGVFTVVGKVGRYEIQPKGFIGRNTFSGPKIKINIQPDSTRAAKVELETEFASNIFKAGDTLPDLTCKIYAEDENLLQGSKHNWIQLKLGKQGAKASTLLPDQRRKNDQSALFAFSGRRVPTEAGEYSYTAVYGDPKTPAAQLSSEKVTIKVVADSPVKLEPTKDVQTPTVSNTKAQACRVLLKHLVLCLKDKYGNTAGQELTGKVSAEIVASAGAVNELPCLAGNKKLSFPLADGECILSNLMVQENCPGRDGSTYLLRCTAEINELPKNQQVLHCDISFFFYNDVKKQQQMAALTKEHDNVKTAIATYKSLFVTAQQLIDELTLSLKEAREEELQLKNELRKNNVSVSNLGALLGIDTLIQSMVKEKDVLLKKPRRMCGLQPAPDDPHVVGKIAHLAQVEDADIARVLSWHMSADMDCVVTLTTKKAKEVYKMTGGKQQVLPLDSIFKKTLPEWNKPLPHERIRQGWKPTGNPVYARNCLVFPKHEEHCRIVFGMLLGDTVILNSLDDANAYRQEIVKHTHCPTILTREGDRIRSNGKFGGLMNKALPVEKLRGAVFGEPIAAKYHSLSNNINLLQSYKQAVEKRQQAEIDLQEQKSHQNIPEMKAKYKECADAEAQLAEIEARLGLSAPGEQTQASNKRDSTSLDEDADYVPSPKRAKSVSTPAAGRSPTQATARPPTSATGNRTPASNDSEAMETENPTPTRTSARKRKPTRRG